MNETMKLFIAFLISTVAVLLFWRLTFTFGLAVAIYATKSVLVVFALTVLIRTFAM